MLSSDVDRSLTSLFALVAVVVCCLSSLTVSSYEGQTSFDYIVVGAGTAGSVVASELATNLPSKQILLIEEGYHWVANPRIDDLSYFFDLQSDDTLDKGYYTTPQANLNDREVHLPRARITGGCGSHNANIFIFANENDFSDRWGDINGWTLDDLLPVWDKVQHIAYHNYSDDLASHLGSNEPVLERFFSAAEELGYELNDNYNDLTDGKTQTGVSVTRLSSKVEIQSDNTVYLSRRSSWTDYVEPVLDRLDNLHVLTLTRVDKVLLEEQQRSDGETEIVATGVEAYLRPSKQSVSFYATEGVILSEGVYDTPKLLMLSGVGDCDVLESEFDIDCKVDLPGVGQNLQDHLFYSIMSPPIGDKTDLETIMETQPYIYGKGKGKGKLILVLWH